MVLVQKQTQRPVTQNSLEINPHIMLTCLWQRSQEYVMGKDRLLSKCAWRIGQPHAKE